MGQENPSERLTQTVSLIIEKTVSAGGRKLVPSWIANAAFLEIQPSGGATILTRIAAEQGLRQIARELLRKYEPQEELTAENQHPLFPDLQRMYPEVHGTDEEAFYVPLEQLSQAGRDAHVERIQAMRRGLTRRLDAFMQWCEQHPITKETSAGAA